MLGETPDVGGYLEFHHVVDVKLGFITLNYVWGWPVVCAGVSTLGVRILLIVYIVYRYTGMLIVVCFRSQIRFARFESHR